MLPNERVRAVYQGAQPDQVPLALDLSHWYRKNYKVPFDLNGFRRVEQGLVDLHRKLGAVCYVETGSFYRLESIDPRVRIEAGTRDGVFTTRISTPCGSLHEERVFDPGSYSYNIRKHLLESPADFPVIECLMANLRCRPCWDYYRSWQAALGDLAFLYAQLPYSGSGYLMARHLGVENTVYAVMDYPEQVRRLVQAVNQCNLRILDTIIDGPFETLLISDNYDSNVQTRAYFDAYAREYYTEVARRLHQKGKYLAVHVDGESRGVLAWLAECGVDCADALTPRPMFSATPAEMRRQAGPNLIMSGGIPATIFSPRTSDADFVECVRRWLETKASSSRLIMAAGDQVPTDASYDRIAMLPELVEKFGAY
ncbi:MAG: uroporphyrinogen decarboxylase family protein [Kiritimatiellia bacterium]|nr:hypothetical protein [Lentisphaerota bacterium]